LFRSERAPRSARFIDPVLLVWVYRRRIAFAGLMSWRTVGESEEKIFSAAIITRVAEDPAADVHSRMPLILPKEAEAAWMDPKQTDGQTALYAAQAVAVTVVIHHAVSSRVNNSKSAGADLIDPFPNPA
jgi:putative SOS response-associated peptidase YedK